MGKLRGFLEYDRIDEANIPVANRVKNYKEFTNQFLDKRKKHLEKHPFYNNTSNDNFVLKYFLETIDTKGIKIN